MRTFRPHPLGGLAAHVLTLTLGCDTETNENLEVVEAEPSAAPDFDGRTPPSSVPTTVPSDPEPDCGSIANAEDPAQAFGELCTLGDGWEPDQAIEVVAHPDLASHLCVDGQVPCNTIDNAALSVTIRAALDEFHDNAGAAIRLRWGGVCETCGYDPPAGKIIVRANPDEACAGTANARGWDSDGDAYFDRGHVTFCTWNDTRIWQSFSGGTGYSVHRLLLHELMHALGHAHPSDCGYNPPATVLNASDSPHLEKWDIDSLLTMYQWRLKTRRTRYEDGFNPLTWNAGSNGFGSSHAALSRMTACDRPTLNGTHVAFTDVFGRWVRFNTYRSDDSWDGAAKLPTLSAVTDAHPGIACEDYDNVRIFYAETDGFFKAIHYIHSEDAGQTWSAPVLTDDTRLRHNQGIDATYDPATGLYVYTLTSNVYEVGTRVVSPGSEIRYYKKNPGAFGFCDDGAFSADCWRTSDTPSIACADASVGEFNCIVAWSDTDWWRVTKYAPAKVVAAPGGGHVVELGDIRTHGYITMGTPDVAWAMPGTSNPWRITLHQGGATAYTWTKPNGTTANWVDQRGFSSEQAIVSPSLGALYRRFWWFSIPRAVSLTTSTPF